MKPRDVFIAATTEVPGLTLATRKASDFEAIVKDILTPWNEREGVSYSPLGAPDGGKTVS